MKFTAILRDSKQWMHLNEIKFYDEDGQPARAALASAYLRFALDGGCVCAQRMKSRQYQFRTATTAEKMQATRH